MDLLNLMREITAFVLLIRWTTADSSSHRIVTTCRKSLDSTPPEWFENPTTNPSPIHNLSAELSESRTSLTVRWAINVDSTTRTLTGTWIKVDTSYYRCEYQPPFSSEQSLDGLQQLWFNFTVSNVTICPSTSFDISAYNLPPPPAGTKVPYSKSFQTAEFEWDAHVSSVHRDGKIVVTFNESFAADSHTVKLEKESDLLATAENKGGCKAGECQVELEYMGPCKDFTISITPHFENCRYDGSVWHEVNCMNGSELAIGVGCMLALIFVLLCCSIMCKILRRGHGSKRSPSVRMLVVYPAVDDAFQRAVMLLTQSLQSHGGVTVAIDVWERRSLAEQGPLRWLNNQADLADRVLVILPPQRTDNLNPDLIPSVTDDTVSASASNLFALTLNLVSSAAHDPHGRDKFWVINLDADNKSVQTELRGCRTFVLPRDLERLHQQLPGGEIKSTSFRCFCFKNTLEQMKINTDYRICSEDNSLDEKPEFLP